jgi:hypothetical protein
MENAMRNMHRAFEHGNCAPGRIIRGEFIGAVIPENTMTDINIIH